MVSSANLSPLLLLIKLSLLISTIDSTAAKSCKKANSCSAGSLAVRFPFQLLSDPDNQDRQQPRCGYPGFELWCNHTETESESAEIMISLPSGIFTVKGIFYESQVLTIDDPAKCLPNRFLERNFTLSGTPFSITNLGSYTFLNCSSSAKLDFRGEGFEPIPCLSGEGYTVIAKPTMLFESTPSFCGVLATVMVPVVSSNRWWVDYSWEFYLRAYVGMAWHEPRCGDCEVRGGDCGFTGQAGLQIGCFNLRKHGLSKGSQYVLYFITALVVVGFLCFNCRLKQCFVRATKRIMVYTRSRHSNHNHELPNAITSSSDSTYNIVSEANQSLTRLRGNVSTDATSVGLDETVIRTYPKSLVGESRRLLSSNYSACPICLSEYRTKDTLRTLPDCFHYFHSDCIDEWLRMNSTCPLCRHSPFISPRTTL